MRKFSRGPEPDILRDHGADWNAQWVNLRVKNPSAKFHWYRLQNRDVRDWIRVDLGKQTQEHCSFCDRYTVEPDSIEHFRPKSQFPELAYSWENLYFCCGGCQNHKQEVWDDALLNPDATDYSFERYFQFDFSSGAISPNENATVENQHRAQVTIDTYGLDTQERRRFRKLELRRWENATAPQLDDFAYRDFIAPPTSAVKTEMRSEQS